MTWRTSIREYAVVVGIHPFVGRGPVRLAVLWMVGSLVLSGCGDRGPVTPGGLESDFVGFHAEGLLSAVDSLARIPEMRGVLVARRGEVALERYFHGVEASDVHDVRSVTKSFTSALIGFAIAAGDLAGLDATLGDYLVPDVTPSLSPEKAAISIRDLLTMTSGFEWNQWGGGPDFNQWAGSEDHVQFVLDRPLVHEPGTWFEYSDGAVNLLSVMLTQATGLLASEYAAANLFSALGLSVGEWAMTNRGQNAAGVGLEVSIRDMWRLGELYRAGGVWNGAQLLPAEWVAASITRQVDTRLSAPFISGYGYLFWVGQTSGHAVFYANGHGGQFIVVVPDLELVLVTQCDWRGLTYERAGRNWTGIIQILLNEVVSSAVP